MSDPLPHPVLFFNNFSTPTRKLQNQDTEKQFPDEIRPILPASHSNVGQTYHLIVHTQHLVNISESGEYILDRTTGR